MIRQVGEDDFQEQLDKGGLTVVDFGATWCGPCRKMEPIMESIAEKMGDQAEFVRVDVDESQKLAAEYQITSIPHLVVLKDGQPVAETIGLRSEEELQAWIDSHR